MKVSTRQKSEAILLIFYLLLVLLDIVVFGLIWMNFYRAGTPVFSMGNMLVIGLSLVVYTNFARLYDGFEIKLQRVQEIVYSHVITFLMSGVIMYIVMCIMLRRLANILPLLGYICVWSIISVVWSYGIVHLMKQIIILEKALAIYDNPVARKNGMKMTAHMSWSFIVEKQMSIIEGLDNFISELDSGIYDHVLLFGLTSSERNDIVKHCILENISVCVRLNIGDFLINSAQTSQVDHLPIMFIRRDKPSLFYIGIKRFIDIVCSLLALIVLSYVLEITALAIKLEDRGSAIYTQKRYILNGRVFSIYKFRSMKENADNGGTEGIVILQNDDRITKVGKIIRMAALINCRSCSIF